ncbi:hypothetical protein [Clostridium botulinum]|uniref:hypothetical protein n=1 Tax=Clostridium botulinum TaxID=1491 RepID=UPI001C9AC16B|nr:hypothetical protein [Clostridium botulinum]MBY6838788.1 hypothetical protein [Clostridium botulinum]
MDFSNYTYVLTNLEPNEFNKKVIEKAEYQENLRLLDIEDIEEVAKIMQVENYKYCYDIQDDIFYTIKDFK